MDEHVFPSKRRRLDRLVNNICLNKTLKELNGNKLDVCEGSSIHHKIPAAYPCNDIITVQPQEPDRKTKVYVLRRSSQLTSGKQLQCSKCGILAFKLHRVPLTNRSSCQSESKSHQICQRCFFSQQKQATDLAVTSHYKSQPRNPLGITCNRTSDAWRLIRRDMMKGSNLPTSACPVVTILNGHMHECVSNTYCSPDGQIIQAGDVPNYLLSLQGKAEIDPTVASIDNHLKRQSDIIDPLQHNDNGSDCIHLDHDYMINVQSDVTIDTKNLPQKISLPIQFKSDNLPVVKQAITTAKKINHPITLKDVKEMPGKKPVLTPKSLSKPTQETNEIARQGISCPLCKRVILKSYSCWKKINTPEKYHYLFKNGIDIVRACRRCIPYRKPKHSQIAVHKLQMKEKKLKSKEKLSKVKKKKVIHEKIDNEEEHKPSTLSSKVKANLRLKLAKHIIRNKAKEMQATREEYESKAEKLVKAKEGVNSKSPSQVETGFKHQLKLQLPKVETTTKISSPNSKVMATDKRCIVWVKNCLDNNNNNSNTAIINNRSSVNCSSKKINSKPVGHEASPSKSCLKGETDTFDSESISLQTGLKSLRSGRIVIFNLEKEGNAAGKSLSTHNHNSVAESIA